VVINHIAIRIIIIMVVNQSKRRQERATSLMVWIHILRVMKLLMIEEPCSKEDLIILWIEEIHTTMLEE
jgi:hypothetical protein